MKNAIGSTLAGLRREKKLMQKDVAASLSARGFNVSAKTIYNWEKGLAYPGVPQFLALCDILEVDDVLWQFADIHKDPYAGLNNLGRQKAHELIDLLLHVDMYRTGERDPALSGNDSPDDNIEHSSPVRLLRLYDIPASAGTGNFLDDSSYEMIEMSADDAPDADFALRLSGDSMTPLLTDGQIINVKKQDALSSGEIGIFIYSGEVYCKKLIANGRKAYLRSLNPEYEDIEIKDDFGFQTVGKVLQ